MELYQPPINAIIPKSSEYYKTTETFLRRSKASRENAIKFWSDPKNHERVNKKAKPLDVFDMEGNFVATYPSSRKAAQALGIPKMMESNIRAVARGDGYKSIKGFQFRFHKEGVTKIEPWAKAPHKPHRRGWHRDNSHLQKPCFEQDDRWGVLRRWDSLKECAADLGCSYSALWRAMSEDRSVKGHIIKFETKEASI